MRENQRECEGSGEWRVVQRRNPRFKPYTNYQAYIHRRHQRVSNSYRDGGRWMNFEKLENEAVTVFVDNLPQNTTIGWLWNVFGLQGKILDVYLSKKKRLRNPRPFAFVRFNNRLIAKSAIWRRNGWVVWGCKLIVSESKYKRQKQGNANEGDAMRTETTHKNEESPRLKSYKDTVLKGMEKENVVNLKVDSPTYDMTNSKVVLKSAYEEKEKLSKSIVCKALTPINMKEAKEMILKEFHSTEHEASMKRKTWIEILEILAHAWNNENAERIGSIWGNVLHVKEEDLENYNSLRVFVEITATPTILARMNVEVDGTGF
ncbi:hypothetical protein PIB30_054584 [Stylosanthes scabra]|uniref:RRM domain-containing protein n=1 Tax=Stylosanthes scabra TaxID=79078 RepID=A0ABU6WLK7_9FABA|nr:hypothetical protein [Stylosanthes scabra]